MHNCFDDTDIIEAIERLTKKKNPHECAMQFLLDGIKSDDRLTPKQKEELENEIRSSFAEIQAKEALKD